jgi:MiaB/RimO family radical SAM methylthiotransferase
MIATVGKEKKLYIYSNGCIENIQSAGQFYNYLKSRGFKLTLNPKQADFIIVNTCAVAKLKVIFSINKIKELQNKKKKGAVLVVSGCLPRIDELGLKKVFNGPVIDVRNPDELIKLFGSQGSMEDYVSNTMDEYFLSDYKGFIIIKQIINWLKSKRLPFPSRIDSRIKEYEDKSMFYIKISEGCLNDCAYCAIRLAKGRLKSRPINKIIAEFKEAVNRGFKRVVLCGDETGSYGLDIGLTFANLLDQLTLLDGDFKIGIRSLSPCEFMKYFESIRQSADKDRISFLSVPVQSGSNRILQMMGRNYRAEDIERHLSEIKNHYPGIMLRSHFIVGFPGETEEDFDRSLRIIDKVDFDCVVPVIFSAMKGTKALSYKNQVPLFTRNVRFLRMLFKSLYNIYIK